MGILWISVPVPSAWVRLVPVPGGKETIAAATLGKLIKRLYGDRATVHGFRSSFRTWASERTNVTRDTCEMAPAHRVGSDVWVHPRLFGARRECHPEVLTCV